MPDYVSSGHTGQVDMKWTRHGLCGSSSQMNGEGQVIRYVRPDSPPCRLPPQSCWSPLPNCPAPLLLQPFLGFFCQISVLLFWLARGGDWAR
ncbi:hypothetical protein RRG08_036589 [Elysia crispata]|uniref:Uncharacterized protein n=1 Tax=Elysia crispata TaxID=231223 RepID=A0AAE0ZQY0_9GAST|nr:hypothetical protein RRG08_036589 [Elysia crispata]